jgi:mono/diheme cytochrome c family protein
MVICSSAAGARAGEGQTLEARGKAVLETHCGRCHGIEAASASPLEIAPHMRDIYLKFPTRELEEELKEGKVSRHKEMPQIAFSDEDVEAILTYLHRLANE